ncbi:hypothetical protein [Bacillus thuringiensis]|uniref:hypothetical protein n=1 Tax=Bacillus thuringiensis TaxID=1428 RepID=UPI000BF45C6B|nr:hypothetical protein [Bacillus thuringiensis]MED3355619.1 hypothetical protein [Bacillus thuringiensis]PFS47342.1 hypothetical protein COK87_28310 [Bacillus thuringiensis]
MWHDIFFDKNGVFQWASIAAIVSFLAFVSSLISIGVTSMQGKKNRRSTTLVTLRIQDLKDLREQAVATILLIRSYVEEKDVKSNPSNENILNTDPIIRELNMHLNKLFSKVYRYTFDGSGHGSKLMTIIATNQIMLLNLDNIKQLVDIEIQLYKALDEYSAAEYQEIQKML